MMGPNYAVYVIVDRRFTRGRPVTEIVRAALQGGATVIQLREKEANTREMIALAEAIHAITREAGVPLIVNDRVDVALAVGAEGVHLGPEDMPVDTARAILGPERIIGASAGTVEEALEAERAGASYLGVGDVFGTKSKADAGTPIGLAGLAEIATSVSIPVVAIGGITPKKAEQAIAAGATGVAVISAVVSAQDPEAATRQLVAAVHSLSRR